VEKMNKNEQIDFKKYWQDKEQEIGEKIIGKDMSEYIGGHPDLTEQAWGILFYTKIAFYFKAFPRKNWITSLLGGKEEKIEDNITICILWKNVQEVCLPKNKKSFFSFLFPTDNRIFINYQENNAQHKLVFTMSSNENKKKFVECYNQSKKGTK